MLRVLIHVTVVLAMFKSAYAGETQYTWRYYRPGNTGIQGDYNEAIWIDAKGEPYIGGYDPFFEEGGFAHFMQAENRWVNYSNIDYPVIGHPNDTGTTRVRDIVPEASGKLWLGTWRGALSFDPAIGASSLTHHGPENSGINDDFVWDIDRAPDGTMWFANNGSARFDPATYTWTRWDNMGNTFLSVQPKVGGGYLVWSSTRPPFQDYTFVFDSDTQQWTIIEVLYPSGDPGDVAGMPGKDCVDETGNFWALRLTQPGDYDSLDYRRPDGTWVTPPEPYDGVTFNISAFKAYGDGGALLVDGNGLVYQFNGSSWISLGQWPGAGSQSADIDAAGNVWVCGTGGAAKRDAQTGQWQRYRITNTSCYDSFIWDLTLDTANGHMYSGANAGPGVGGMTRFDGQRWTGWNNATYGLGFDWPFPNDNCQSLAYRPSTGGVAVNPYWFYGIHEWTGSQFNMLMPTGGAVRMVEDSLGRLWALGEYYSLQYYDGASWVQEDITAWGSKIQRDPDASGMIWATTGHEFKRTDGSYSFSRTVGDFPELGGSDTFRGLAAAPDGIAWIGATMLDTSGGALIRVDSTTGDYQMLRFDQGWPLPGNYVAPLANTSDGRVWMQYAMQFDTPDGGGLCWYDPSSGSVGVFPGPLGGGPQWGGLPHSQVEDCEVRLVPGGYELWLTCVSRGLAVLTVLTASTPADLDGDDDVDGFDLALLLGAWGICNSGPACPADLDGSGTVNGLDLAILLAAWE